MLVSGVLVIVVLILIGACGDGLLEFYKILMLTCCAMLLMSIMHRVDIANKNLRLLASSNHRVTEKYDGEK